MTSPPAWVVIEPRLHLPRSRRWLLDFARALSRVGREQHDHIDELANEFLEPSPQWPAKDRQRLVTLARVFADLTRQGWGLRVRGEVLSVQSPLEIEADHAAEKQRVRRQEQLKRDEQLRQAPVRAFVRGMERRRLHNGRFVSIFSLMRDGRELAESLRRVREAFPNDGVETLAKVVSPYLQFASSGELCEWTGLALQDIWRYFRHTWSNQYTSVPGRTMLFLVRDAAVEFHPVIGIGALSSPIVQIRERDEWIGWHPTTFLEEIKARPTAKIAKWLVGVVDQAMSEIYVDDLVRDGIIKLKEIESPTPATVKGLAAEGLKQRELHHRFVKAQDLKNAQRSRTPGETSHWEDRAISHLFRSKRSLVLADLLGARIVMKGFLGAKPTSKQLASLLADPDGLHVAKRILRKAKGDRVGIAMADISVCGAVAPYNPILGGKLVSMLATSPEVVRAYRVRYGEAESEIASSMAGRAIIRPPHLVFLGTTSLYGVGASQYNRIKIPCEALGGRTGEEIEYVRLGMSEAFGTSHYSDETIDELVRLVTQQSGGQRVNSIFGEGVSPKLRKVREGLELLDLPSELFLKHGRRRILYGITLVRNTRDFLLGVDERPDFLVPTKAWPEATSRIVAWWTSRWLRNRIHSDEVLTDVARHRLVHPIIHGARVVIPADESAQRALSFDQYEQAPG